jgi:hypothetical protein
MPNVYALSEKYFNRVASLVWRSRTNWKKISSAPVKRDVYLVHNLTRRVIVVYGMGVWRNRWKHPGQKEARVSTRFNFFVFQCRPSLRAVFFSSLRNDFISDIVLLFIRIDITRVDEARSDVYGESSTLVIVYLSLGHATVGRKVELNNIVHGLRYCGYIRTSRAHNTCYITVLCV